MKNLLKGIKLITVLALTLTFVGCDDDDVVLPKLEAGFTHTINQDTGTVTFINTSTNADRFEWNFGDIDGTTSTLINPIKTYPSGTYTVILNATNVAGASGEFQDTFTISIPEEVALPISFDNPLVDYGVQTFNGVTFSIVENPDANGANSTLSNVGEIVNSGATFEGFFFDLGAPLDLTTDKTVKMLFWSSTATDVLLKLENGTGPNIEVSASHNGSGWEELYFTFNSSSSYSTITLFVDGPGTSAGTFYVDEIMQANSADIPCTDVDLEIPMDFDCEGIDYATKIVGNVGFTVVDNPELSGINSEATKVGQITNGGDNFENAFFNLDIPVDFSTDNGITLKLFSNQVLPILLKFEDGTEADVEDNQMHMGTGWEELTFTLNSTGSYNDMVLFVAFNQTDTGTFFVDDFMQVAGNTGSACTPETAESITAADLNITFQTDTPSVIEDNIAFSYIDNPDASGINTSCRVGQVTRFNNSPFDNVQIDLTDKLDFNSSEGLRMKVWSPVANTPVLLKLEEIGNPGNSVEIQQNTTAANAWEELTFDFNATTTPQFNKLVIFFNFNVSDASTYFFDDLMVYGSGTPTPGGNTLTSCAGGNILNDYESSDNTIFNNFGGGVGSIEDNTDMSINTSAKVARYVKNTGEVFAGITVAIDSNIAFDGGVFSLDVNSQTVRQLLFKLEGLNVEKIIPTSGTGWETLTYDFSDVAGSTGDVTAITLIMDNGTVGDGTADWTIEFDNMTLCSDSMPVAGDCPAPPAGELLSNGGFEANNGDGSCWQLNAGGTNVPMVTSSDSNTGTYSVQMATSAVPNHVPNIKQERFAPTIVGGVTVQVTFNYKVTNAFVDGSILQVFTFSERSTNGAITHDLGNADTSTTDTWLTYTGTFVTDGSIDEGLSLLIQATCGGAPTCAGEVFIDDVVVTQL